MKGPKKLIEVALPLDDINVASAREKSIRHGHPSTLHLWWARRPLAAARAVLFAQMVNDPGGARGYGAYPGQTKADAQRERERLFGIIRELVKWENTTNEEVLEQARAEIRKSWAETCKLTGEDPEKLPAFHDPFAGGGTIPLEAQRLGLEAYASDLNPVAVLINKAMIEIPPKFAGKPPVNPEARNQGDLLAEKWRGAQGLAEDVRYYGKWMRDEAEKRIGHLYPKIEITKEMAKDRPDLKPLVGQKLTVNAWLWAHTVKSPNPAFSNVEVPLVSTFMLSTKEGKEAYVHPVIENGSYHFTVKTGKPKDTEYSLNGTKSSGSRSAFLCLMSKTPIPFDYIRNEGKFGRMGTRLMAIVAKGERGRIFLSPTKTEEVCARTAIPNWKPETPLHGKCRVNVSLYGLDTYGDLFTSRQLVAMTTFSDLVKKAQEKVKGDAHAAGMHDDGKRLDAEGTGSSAYADAVGVYLGCGISRAADYWNSVATWEPSGGFVSHAFTRQAIPMIWDFAESNPFSDASGNWDSTCMEWVERVVAMFSPANSGKAIMADAQTQSISAQKIVSTDPPYYDNIGYADLSDFFYVWLRRSLRSVFPDLFTTLAVPKAEELVATPYRHGSKVEAEAFFLNGMTQAMRHLAEQAYQAFPVTIYYAFKQSENETDAGTASTGWETFLAAVISSGFAISGTWPMRTERGARSVGIGANALASSIILVCRHRGDKVTSISRKQFLRELDNALPDALETMIGGEEGTTPIAPVDLAQAAIGPGMAIFSKYAAVLEADGSPMTVRNALIIINKAIDEYFSRAESDMDSDTRFCLDWFQQHGFKTSVFGEADVLARAKGTSVEGVRGSGVIESGGGKVRLLKVSDYPADWDPSVDTRIPIWEACHQMSRALQVSESAAGILLAKMPEKSESIRQLAYRLYTLCERKGWAEEARAYNDLVACWPSISEEAQKAPSAGRKQGQLNLYPTE